MLMDRPLNPAIITHWCPKIGNSIRIDTSRSKSCVECKFNVSRLVYVTPIFVQYVFLSHIVSILFFVYYLFVQDMIILLISILVFAINFTFFIYAKYKISKKHQDIKYAKIQELRNYAMRKF